MAEGTLTTKGGKMPLLKIGLFSRVDYGSPGFRKGLLDLAYERFREAGVHFVILAGGLVSGKFLKQALPSDKEERDNFLDGVASELAEFLPRFEKDKDFKTYVMVSPAYDGAVGAEVIERLVGLREDLRLYHRASERFPLKGIQKKIAVLVPTKASWRADYASTPVDRILKDELKRSTQAPADVYVIGCFGVFMHRPKGESPCEYFALPALSKPEEITATENQVGAVILEINDEVRAANISFKDVVSNERELIKEPEGLTDLEKKVFCRLRKGPATIGVIDDGLRESQERIGKAIEKLVSIRRRNYPRICEDADSGRYDFDVDWIQSNLGYSWYPEKEIAEDRIVGFACMHAGSVFTDYEFVVNELPRIILSEDADVLAGVGDLIQGLKHDLMLRDEVIAGANYTKQEELAAKLLASAIIKVFASRLEANLGKVKAGDDISRIVDECLVKFVYIAGNHDEWVKPLGFNPLDKFRAVLATRLRAKIEEILAGRNLNAPSLAATIEAKVLCLDKMDNRFSLPSGIKVGLLHPHTGRAQTTTLRLQQSMANLPDCQLSLIGNFHTTAAMALWQPGLGQRAGMQFGTLMHKSDFEFKKNKIVDFGIACVRIMSHKGRVIETQTMFCGKPCRKTFSNEDLLDAFERKLGIL